MRGVHLAWLLRGTKSNNVIASNWLFSRQVRGCPAWPRRRLIVCHLDKTESPKRGLRPCLPAMWMEVEHLCSGPSLPRFFLGRPTTQKGSKKSLHTQKGSKKSLRTFEAHGAKSSGSPYRNPYVWQGTIPERSEKSLARKRHARPPHCQGFFWASYHTKRVQKKPSHTKRVQKKPSTLEAHEAKSNGNSDVWQGAIPERSDKKPDQKTEHLPPHCQGFFWNVLPHKKGPKKAFGHLRPMRPSQMGTQTSDKGLFQKGLKTNLTRKPNTCPHTAKVFFGTSHHTKESKKSLRTQKGSKKSLQHWRPMRPSQMGTHTSDTCPHTAKVFLGRPTTQKGSKKSLRTQKVQKKPQVGTHTSDKGLSQKRLKKAWPEPTTRKGSKKSLLKQVGKKALSTIEKGQKKPRRYRKKPSPYVVQIVFLTLWHCRSEIMKIWQDHLFRHTTVA